MKFLLLDIWEKKDLTALHFQTRRFAEHSQFGTSMNSADEQSVFSSGMMNFIGLFYLLIFWRLDARDVYLNTRKKSSLEIGWINSLLALHWASILLWSYSLSTEGNIFQWRRGSVFIRRMWPRDQHSPGRDLSRRRRACCFSLTSKSFANWKKVEPSSECDKWRTHRIRHPGFIEFDKGK